MERNDPRNSRLIVGRQSLIVVCDIKYFTMYHNFIWCGIALKAIVEFILGKCWV